MDKILKVLTLNVRGLHDSLKRRKTFEWLKDQNAQIIFLQETFCTKDLEPYLRAAWKGGSYHSISNSSHSKGVAILFSEHLEYQILNKHSSNDGRKLLLNVKINEENYSIVCIYAPNGIKERSDFFKNLNRWINRYAINTDNLIVCGDMNCCLGDLDRRPATHINDASRKHMNNFMTSNDLCDMWKEINKTKCGFTYIDKNYGTRSRLDYILVSRMFKLSAVKIYVSNVLDRDHKAVIAEFNCCNNKRGKGYWKLNNSLMDDDQYSEGIQKVLRETEIEYGDLKSKRMIWEIFKIKVKEFSVKYSISKQKLKPDVKTTQKQLDEILNDIEENGLNKNNILLKSKYELEINEYYDNKAKGYQIRSRAKWLQEGEKSTSYFLGLESKRQSTNTIKKLLSGERIIESDSEILDEAALFYEKLYSSKEISMINIDEYLSDIDIPHTLNEDEKKYCDEPLNETEVYNAIVDIKGNKSPGYDGLSPEFYKKYWKLYKDYFMNMVDESFKKGELPNSMKRAIISLLFKKGNSMFLKNYRPISLTNYDYKIIAFTLAKRLQKVIKKLVSNDQTAYIKNRFIGCNIRIICDIIENANIFDKPGIAICLDFEKSFDTLEWNFLFKTLEKLNFGENFIRWIKTLYTDPRILIKNNGWLSNEIKIERGVRQGCPISALLFILTVELLALSI